MFDCAIALAYENIPAVKAEIDALPMTEGDCYWLNGKLDKAAEEELTKQFDEEPSTFYKIVWNKNWSSCGEGTLYQYLIKKMNNMEDG